MSAEREGLRARIERTLDQAEEHIRDRSFSYASAAIANARELLTLLREGGEPTIYLRPRMVDAIRADIAEGESGIVVDHIWFNPEADTISAIGLVPLYTQPAPEPEPDARYVVGYVVMNRNLLGQERSSLAYPGTLYLKRELAQKNADLRNEQERTFNGADIYTVLPVGRAVSEEGEA